jgi:hypothetical protein
MLRYGMKYADKGAAFYRHQHRQWQIKELKSKAASLGFHSKSPQYRSRPNQQQSLVG